MYVNGQQYAHRDGLTLYALLEELRVDKRAVTVMRDDDIYRPGSIPDVPLTEPDVIEIVTMMQGG
jgi:thiamine biosynthesis protein ThiS